MDIHIVIIHLKKLFDVASRTKRYETSRELSYYKMTKCSSINMHVLFIIENYLST
jgi:hypothetical protein